jgi:hypothetical protein
VQGGTPAEMTVAPVRTSGSREVDVVMAATRPDVTPARIRELTAAPFDWNRLARIAVATHATPGLWQVLSNLPDLPTEAGAIQSVAVVNEFRGFHLRRLIGQLVATLEADGIEVLLLKGAAFIAGGTERNFRRTMWDIDLMALAGKEDVAWRACRAAGWLLADRDVTEERYRRHHHLAPLVDPEGIGVGLEIHRQVLMGSEYLGIRTEDVVARARRVSLNEVQVLVPSLEDMLLVCCLHFAWSNKLHRSAWRAFSDAHTIVSTPGFSWERFVEIAPAGRTRLLCYWALRVAAKASGLAVPRAVLHQLDPEDGGFWAKLLERHFVQEVLDLENAEVPAERVRRRLWLTAMRADGVDPVLGDLWTVGGLDPASVLSREAPRSAWRAALSTAVYATRLIARN